MKTPLMATSVACCCVLALATAACAGIRPYLRAGYGGSQLLMSDVNSQISAFQASLNSAAIPAQLAKVGPGVGPSASAGLWLLPSVRVGATVSYHRATLENRVHQPGVLFYDDQLDFQMTEVGGEIAYRVVPLAGLTVCGQMAQGRAELKEGYANEDASGNLYIDDVASRTRTTYAAFLGLDQTNHAGWAGYFRAGYVWRDMGRMPSTGTASNGVTTVPISGQSVPMNFSGFCFQLGLGFDAFLPRE